MSRLHLTFACEGSTLAATLDTAPLTTGLLLVSGGNELRSGAFRGQARLAQTIAKRGFPVFRYDRRGVGDSEGVNLGFSDSEADIRAALEAFQAIAPQLKRVIGLGNCDAASALMLAGGAGCDGLVLSNPWTIEDHAGGSGDSMPPPQAIRARYLEKLGNPREVARLLRGGVDMRKLAGGIMRAARPAPAANDLATRMQEGLARFDGPTRILLASADRTAQAFEGAWPRDDVRLVRCEGASHAFVEPHAREWLEARILEALRA
ncbi:hydrolase 1, exosortase A system-associated [Alteriqipengyuania lutimaris]|uniref:Hydrolase 1, exosortase A system-associated n=1 Tax=Alteriqipengyuania lutimaris TaxID=1538146 RepID=A0A395LNZ6_9SPHN|nr:hydrolase 1, exosortase A system-associated [Alteriqipengyuania lutimaris]MBB3032746.1 exosortase A-associated hydrolase 1 [Alteriqipengyuania lutimaris]RDS78147.1 hydrolase 1, exosortase A system-associated [Alteriqipengyuania lutimaris]